MVASEVARDRWVFRLAPQLTGKAQQAYAALGPEDALDFNEVKAAIFRRYNISEETYRQIFRGAKNRAMAARLQDLVDKWMTDCDTAKAVMEIVTEQLLKCHAE